MPGWQTEILQRHSLHSYKDVKSIVSKDALLDYVKSFAPEQSNWDFQFNEICGDAREAFLYQKVFW